MRLPPSVLAGVLLLLFVLYALSTSRIKAPTYDEPAHIGATTPIDRAFLILPPWPSSAPTRRSRTISGCAT